MAELYDQSRVPTRNPLPMGLLEGWCYFAACALFQAAAMYACFYLAWVPLSVVVISWLALGAWLNRNVLVRLVIWHPVYDTLAQVTADKVRFFLFWPITYAVLLLRLTIDRLI